MVSRPLLPLRLITFRISMTTRSVSAWFTPASPFITHSGAAFTSPSPRLRRLRLPVRWKARAMMLDQLRRHRHVVQTMKTCETMFSLSRELTPLRSHILLT